MSKLKAYVEEDRSLYNPQHPLTCLCGKKVNECQFWNSPHYALPGDFKELNFDLNDYVRIDRNMRAYLLPYKALKRFWVKIVKRAFYLLSSKMVYRSFNCEQLVENNLAVLRGIASTNNCKYIIDSSKDIYRFYMYYRYNPSMISMIHLYRDLRGVAWSNIRRGKSFKKVVRNWFRNETRIRLMQEKMPKDSYLNVSYEGLCNNPEFELRRICGFLNLEYAKDMEMLTTIGKHHIGGTPSKFNFSNNIVSLDDSYKEKLTYKQMSIISSIEQKLRNRFGELK